VTDDSFLKIDSRLGEHFVQPGIRVLASGERAQALAWLQG
jgi:hypothetical protein